MNRRSGAMVLAWLLLAMPAGAQAPATKGPQTSPPAEITDPLGRHTPRGTITGFTEAVHRKDFVAAAAYMQLTERQRPNAESLATTLTTLIDRYFTHPIASLSASPAGSPTDGLPLDRERVMLTMPQGEVDIVLRRVSDKQAGPIWLISSESLARVPTLGRELEASWLEQRMPEGLVDRTLFGASLAQWSAWALSLVVPFLLLWTTTSLFLRLARHTIRNPTWRAMLDHWSGGLQHLAVMIETLIVHLAMLPLLTLTLQFRVVYMRSVLSLIVLLLACLLWRFIGLSFYQAGAMAQRRGRAGTQTLMMMGSRVVRVLLVMATVFVLLTLMGVNTTTALAGLGLGGVALALGAQKSVENLLGGIFLLTDKALAVGDFCCIADRLGVIEDITLRSVRLRTLEQTLVSIPASVLAQANIENFTSRGKILIQTTIRLHYGTSAVQLRAIVERIHTLVITHPQLEAEGSRVRVMNFGEKAIEIELFVYVKTADYDRFTAVREDVLLAAGAIVESEGSALARPTDYLYLSDAARAPRQTAASS